MFRLIFLLSLFPIVIALAARWWFGMRVLVTAGGRKCRCDLKRWVPPSGDGAQVHRAEAPAAEFGKQLHAHALAQWRERAPKAAASRENSLRFGMAVPPLGAIIAIFAVVTGKIPLMGAAAVLLGATALSAVIGLLSLPPELAELARAAKDAEKNGDFPDHEDRDAVVRCAMAHAWENSLPPVLRWLHR